jgi:hypothetical protein
MSFIDQIGGLLTQYANGQGARNRDEARAHYDQISQVVPTNILGSIIGPALSSLGADQVQERVQNSATEMSADQRGQFVRMLLNGLSGSGGDVSGLLRQLGINREIQTNPQQANPSDVAKLARHAQQTRPESFNQAMQFYAQHPTLVKVLGTMAIAKIAQRLSERHPQPTQ